RTGDSSAVKVSDHVIAIGNALGRGGTPAAAPGTVQALQQSITAADSGIGSAEHLSGLIQVDAVLQPGDSGGPMIAANGATIGMNTAASSGNGRFSQSPVGFAIPINAALQIAHQIEAGKGGGNIQIGLPGFLGVEVSPNSQQGAA